VRQEGRVDLAQPERGGNPTQSRDPARGLAALSLSRIPPSLRGTSTKKRQPETFATAFVGFCSLSTGWRAQVIDITEVLRYIFPGDQFK